MKGASAKKLAICCYLATSDHEIVARNIIRKGKEKKMFDLSDIISSTKMLTTPDVSVRNILVCCRCQ